MAPKNMVELNDGNWQAEVLESDVPVLVDFWAPWCGPCRAVAPVVTELAEEHPETLKVGKLNVDNARGVAAKYQIRSIPTLLVIKGGRVVGQRVGAGTKADLKSMIDKAR